MRRLLLVSPHFPPTNAPDMHRVRIALPYFREFGWDPEVIAVQPEQVLAPRDPFLLATLPPDVPVHRVRAFSPAWGRIPGLGGLGYRCLPAVARQVQRLLDADSRPTLVYFSTTQFAVHAAIPRLAAQPRVKVVMDYQDPWVSHYYRQHPTVRPPGGRLKFALDQFLARRMQARVLPRTAGCTSVSPRYPEELMAACPQFSPGHFLVLPFGGAPRDFEILRTLPPETAGACPFPIVPGSINWVYAGRGGADMARALGAFFGALKEARQADPALARLRIHFLGTDYAAGARARPTVQPIAEAAGVGDLVTERPHRLAYGETLQALAAADAIIVPGSDDPGYTASKIYPCILARKPLLAIFREESSVAEVLRQTRAGVCVTFGANTPPADLQAAVRAAWFDHGAYGRMPATDWAAFEPYTARAMTARLCAFFDRIQPA